MKKIYTLVSAVLLSVSLWAQAPAKMSYQAVIRGANNSLVIEKTVGVRISILQGNETGSSVYSELHTPTTNLNGLASLSIGGGKNTTGDFAKIDWSKGPYFVKTETDVAGGTNYQLTAVSELMSVPYALYAGNSQPGPKGDVGVQGPQGLPGKDGAQGPAGSFPLGTTVGEMKYWDGTKWTSLTPVSNGQIITNCDGAPTWTTGGICPGKIASLNCAGVSVNGSLNNGAVASNVSFVITYSGGNGGSYSEQSTSSTGVVGLTATLQTGSFATGNGSLTFTVSGTPSSVGNALFSLTIAGQVCSISIAVQAQPTNGYGANITDKEGNSYKTVYIGTQQWMAENLKVSKYSDGTAIPNITNNTQWLELSSGAWSYYNNDVANNAKYGKLYNWYVVSKNTNGNKNVCPTGWHVPTYNEWTVLTGYLGGESVAGGKMKEVGTTSWNSPNTDATNTSLFSALPGGGRYEQGASDIGKTTGWWSSPEPNTFNVYVLGLDSNSGGVSIYMTANVYGKSVRCLRD
jgi:uncharacterized protein (TIGR02145 family)